MDSVSVRYCFAYGNNRYLPKFEWKEDTGEQTLWIRNSGLVLNYQKPKPYFAVNLMLALQLGWVKKVGKGAYKIGPNLRRHPYESDFKSEKLAPNTDRTSLFTFADYFHVYQGIVYLSKVYDW